MSDIILKAENIGKRYTLNHQSGGVRYRKFSDVLVHAAKSPMRLFQSTENESRAGGTREDYWALKDVSFEIKQGDIVGFIGRNGAGKSTLLKVLSRITEPTTGRITINGRIASLLEVGTGFHPELTGRENVFLNGAILGMRKEEIKAKFDEIVAFAEVERFLDTPVKRYSSGMYVRLAFAVAAHLEPEILIVDEVLAVGDAEFQRKCLGKMGDVASAGRTVLFVSHNMAAVQGLCSRGIVLDQGTLAVDSTARDAIQRYGNLQSHNEAGTNHWHYRNRGTKVRVDSVVMLVNGQASKIVHAGDVCTFQIHYTALDRHALGKSLSISAMLYKEGDKIVNLWTNFTPCPIPISAQGTASCTIPRWPYRSAKFHLEIYTHIGDDVQDWIDECILFESSDGDFYGSGVTTQPGQGIMFLDHKWTSQCQ